MAILTHANRGNVAVICWNTLNTNTWSVNSETLDGEVSLGIGAETKTLLEINFTEFTCEDGELKEIESEDFEVAANNDRQLKLTLASANETANFKFEKAPRKNADEASYYDSTDREIVYIYVPEDVCEDLDELENKNVTVILGEDNIAVAVIVNEDIEEKDYLTDYDAVKGKVTIGGVKYTLAEDSTSPGAYNYKAKLNGKDYTPDTYAGAKRPIEEALIALGIISDSGKSAEDIEKKIEATVTLNGNDEVKAIELFASAKVTGTSVEALVLKVKETNSTYKITTTEGAFEWDIDEEEDDEIEFPKVYIDGRKAEIRDIEVGNVITVLGVDDLADADVEDMTKIYASTEKVTGKVNKVIKPTNGIKVDGTTYLPSFDVTGARVMTTKELTKATNTTGDWAVYDTDAITKNDEVTLYLNALGEYVRISLDEVSNDYTFGLVTYVASNMTTSGDEEEVEEVKIRVLLPEGNKKYFTLSLDTSDEDLMDELTDDSVLDYAPASLEGKFVMFEADANGVITIEDDDPIILIDGTLGSITSDTDYLVAKLKTGTLIDEEEFTAKYGSASDTADEISAEYDAKETVIFNLADKKIVAKWESIVQPNSGDASKDEFAGATFMIFEDEEQDVPMFIVTNLSTYVGSDATYAIGGEEGLYQVGTKDYADLVGTDGIEFTASASSKEVLEGWVVEYVMASSKISKAFSIIDVEKFYNKDTKKNVATVNNIVDFTTDRDPGAGTATPDTQLKGLAGTEKLEMIELDKIKTRTSTYRLEFVETDAAAIADITVDEDVIVYDLRDGKIQEVDITDIQAEVEDGEAIYAIPCTRGTDDVLFVL